MDRSSRSNFQNPIKTGGYTWVAGRIWYNGDLGRGNSNIFEIFHPEKWGFMIQFDEHIFQMGGSTTN